MKYLKSYEALNRITFKQWLKDNPQDINTTEIDCSTSDLIDIIGIEIFTNLKTLYCFNNQLTKLPTLPSNLEYLYCSNNKLTLLPDLPSNLEYLYCSNNQLTSLPDLTNLYNLQYLNCYNNQLTELPDIPFNLEYLDCSNNKLPYTNLEEYLIWHKTNHPDIWTAKKYNI